MLRYAKKEEAKEVINLLALAMDHFIYALSGYDDEKKALEVLEGFFTQENNRLSYENIIVFEKDNFIAAALCFYDGAKADLLDIPLNSHLKKLGKNEALKECENEFYIDSIAVNEKFRGQKIASKLINFAFDVAKKNGKKLSLIVEKENLNAKKAYEKMGFAFVKEKNFHTHIYEYMEKE